MERRTQSALIAIAAVMLCSSAARAELPQCFDMPSANDDYRVSYTSSVGFRGEDQYSLHHRVGLQIPLWGAAAGAQLTFSNVFGPISESVVGNLRLYLQYFHSFEWADRANIWIGGGVDGYAPTATALNPQEPLAALTAGSVPGDASIGSPDLTFALRPRLHLGTQAWIFSLQVMGAASVQFLDGGFRSALEWGINVSAQAVEWLVIAAEVTGISWLDQAPGWMPQRTVVFAGGLRLDLPGGWMPGLWVRAPATGRENEVGEGVFIGVELLWRHDRNWILF